MQGLEPPTSGRLPDALPVAPKVKRTLSGLMSGVFYFELFVILRNTLLSVMTVHKLGRYPKSAERGLTRKKKLPLLNKEKDHQ